ncbi:MAG TPA: aryl sulfotransferase [Candidatus Marinimicrobia bacterium]|nr:aryl sulfotransferase [Candidatus Neomarinimicrobiota bacterium]
MGEEVGIKKIIAGVAVGLVVCVAFVQLAFGWPSVYPTGVTIYNPEKAFNGYTLFSPMGSPKGAIEPYDKPHTAYLIDMNGNVVHKWILPFPPGLHGVLLPNGHLLVAGRCAKLDPPDRPGYGKYGMGGSSGWLFELDWDGNIVFSHWDPGMHHDFDKLPNGNYIYVAWEKVPKSLQEKVRGGIKGTEHKDGTMFADCFVEINPAGEVVWEWHAINHLDPDIDIIGPIHDRREWTHINDVDVMENGNIVTSSRHLDAVMIIDRKTKEIIWRWGNVAYLDKATGCVEFRRGPKTLGGPHDAHEIPPGYPGAGNILVYDNGMYVDGSRAVEIDPRTGEIVWQSPQASAGRNHFSPFISGAERLPNGNTLICSGGKGRFFEVTRDNEIVWEYVNPYMPFDRFQGATFRVHRYGPDYCPQFKSLPPAKGPAVIPPKPSEFKIAPVEPKR